MKVVARLLILMLWLLGQMPGFAYDVSQRLVDSPTITYDGRARIAYNGKFPLGFGYDSTVARIVRNELRPDSETCDLFGRFAEFLAAKTGPLVEPLPNGALRIQLPKAPLDPFPYAKSPTSRVLGSGVEPGTYVYVRDPNGVVHIAENGPHMHPRVLGGGQPAIGAGEVAIGQDALLQKSTMNPELLGSPETVCLESSKR